MTYDTEGKNMNLSLDVSTQLIQHEEIAQFESTLEVILWTTAMAIASS